MENKIIFYRLLKRTYQFRLLKDDIHINIIQGKNLILNYIDISLL